MPARWKFLPENFTDRDNNYDCSGTPNSPAPCPCKATLDCRMRTYVGANKMEYSPSSCCDGGSGVWCTQGCRCFWNSVDVKLGVPLTEGSRTHLALELRGGIRSRESPPLNEQYVTCNGAGPYQKCTGFPGLVAYIVQSCSYATIAPVSGGWDRVIHIYGASFEAMGLDIVNGEVNCAGTYGLPHVISLLSQVAGDTSVPRKARCPDSTPCFAGGENYDFNDTTCKIWVTPAYGAATYTPSGC